MKRRDTDPGRFSLLRLLDDFAREQGLSIDDDSTQEQLLTVVADSLRQHRNNSARLYGFRVESMFAHVAAALGGCEILTEEDSGVFFETHGNLRRPDFRVLTHNGDQFLVEVKNYHPNDPRKPYPIGRKYVNTLLAYAGLLKIPLKFAIYWSRWNLWTLIDSSHLPTGTDSIELPMGDAMKLNEMNIIGDCMLGTVPPLSLRVYADPTRPRSIDEDGVAGFTASRATLCAAGRDIQDPFESKLAWFFMLHGSWDAVEHPVEMLDDNIEYVETTVSPSHRDDSQGFSTIGFLSAMVSREYLHATSKSGRIRNLVPNRDAADFGILIPNDYKGVDLRLWRFEMLPNYEDITGEGAS